jgi:hypothetical protein
MSTTVRAKAVTKENKSWRVYVRANEENGQHGRSRKIVEGRLIAKGESSHHCM